MALPSLLQGILIYLTQPWPTGKGVHHEGEERGGEDDYSPEEAHPVIPITGPTPAIASSGHPHHRPHSSHRFSSPWRMLPCVLAPMLLRRELK